jgi:hypothetical protein
MKKFKLLPILPIFKTKPLFSPFFMAKTFDTYFVQINVRGKTVTSDSLYSLDRDNPD